MTPRFEVVRTFNGAHAMLDHDSGELMHPKGPRAEADRLYAQAARVETRLRSRPPDQPLRLLDVGLGAGSNAAAAHRISERLDPSASVLEIISFERNLDALTIALHPEHRATFGLDGPTASAATTLLDAHQHESPRTRWRLVLGDLTTTLTLQPAASADIVFWDPFSPRAQPALWTCAAFTILRRLCREGATVHTYSGATSVRTALLLAGFFVGLGHEVSPKKTSTCAATHIQALEHPLDTSFLDRLTRSSAPFPSDAPKIAFTQLQSHPQFTP